MYGDNSAIAPVIVVAFAVVVVAVAISTLGTKTESGTVVLRDEDGRILYLIPAINCP
jgi:hypothetical protein